ncbi:L-alanine exporter AlaE [archaeon]|nr:L-alanine exporter AlaE [archaeon]
MKNNNPDKRLNENLEDIVSSEKKQSWGDWLKYQVTHQPKVWAVDYSLGTVVFNPLMALNEAAWGMHGDEIFWTRLYGSGIGAIVTRPYTIARDLWLPFCKITKESPKWKRILAETSLSAAVNLPIYLKSLSYSGVEDEKRKWIALTGFAMGVCMASTYGKLLDNWRGYWNIDPAIKK